MNANQPDAAPRPCSEEPCEIVILKLQQVAEQNPENWRLRYQLGICYSGHCQQHPLVCPDLALEELGLAAKALRGLEEPRIRAAVLSLLGLMYPSSLRLPAKARLLRAVECYEEAASIYFKCEMFREWARAQHNLGNTWCEFPAAEFPDKWENAIAHYEQALLFRTQQADPACFAATMENLGTAYRQRTAGDKAANVHSAMQCYRRALRLSPLATVPARWAALHNNLGNACLSLPSPDPSIGDSHARHALRHFDLALRVRTLKRGLFDYAVTKLNRGQACFRLGVCGSPAWLAEAVQCLCDARAAFVRTGAATEAGMAQKGLEVAQHALHQRCRGRGENELRSLR
jgi:tetratricopeptide (TPR) repeat protein